MGKGPTRVVSCKNRETSKQRCVNWWTKLKKNLIEIADENTNLTNILNFQGSRLSLKKLDIFENNLKHKQTKTSS